MSAVETVDVGMVVPDCIEPVEAYRCWDLGGGKLRSVTNGVPWTPGEPLAAECFVSGRYAWQIVRGGITLAKAQEYAAECAEREKYILFSTVLAAPSVEPPAGYGYELQPVTHDAPHEDCVCGIYAATDKETPRSYGGNVFGRVKLWGRVVPGSKGLRAEFAYPSEFHVPASLADNPTLKAFGVPIIVEEPPASRIAVALNLAGMAANMGALAIRWMS